MKKTKFRGRIHGGRFDPKLSRQIADLFAKQVDGYEVLVTVEKPGDIRSVKANAYYWGVVLEIIAQHTGYYKEELHDEYKRFMAHNLYDWMYAEEDIVLTNDSGMQPRGRRLRSTSSYSGWEFWTYIEAVRTHAGSFYGLDIPDPRSASARAVLTQQTQETEQ